MKKNKNGGKVVLGSVLIAAAVGLFVIVMPKLLGITATAGGAGEIVGLLIIPTLLAMIGLRMIFANKNDPNNTDNEK